jgi:hypothetical protein
MKIQYKILFSLLIMYSIFITMEYNHAKNCYEGFFNDKSHWQAECDRLQRKCDTLLDHLKR